MDKNESVGCLEQDTSVSQEFNISCLNCAADHSTPDYMVKNGTSRSFAEIIYKQGWRWGRKEDGMDEGPLCPNCAKRMVK